MIKNKFHLWEDTSKHSDTALHYESKFFYPNPLRFSEFFPYCWELLSKILHAYCVLIYGKLKNCIQLSLKLTKIRHIKHNHPVNFHFSNLLHRKKNDFIAKDEWPPKSPDLNPLDYHVWGAMLQAFHKLHPKPKTIPELNSALQQIWDDLPQTTINKVINDFANI